MDEKDNSNKQVLDDIVESYNAQHRLITEMIQKIETLENAKKLHIADKVDQIKESIIEAKDLYEDVVAELIRYLEEAKRK